MDISSVGSYYSEIENLYALKEEAATVEQENIEAEYAVKLIKMAQQSEAIVGTILEDTVEISQEAMQKFMSERGRV